MERRLENMTLEELWELFPISLVAHNPEWKSWATEEIASLDEILALFSPEISHIGSTAVRGIVAKPIVDILVEVSRDYDWAELRTLLVDNGYICMSDSGDRMSFNKGYTPQGYAEKVFHVHIHRPGDNDEILFRDYLLAHPDAAKEYESLKLSLLSRYRHHRDTYTAAKSPFIAHILSLARS